MKIKGCVIGFFCVLNIAIIVPHGRVILRGIIMVKGGAGAW